MSLNYLKLKKKSCTFFTQKGKTGGSTNLLIGLSRQKFRQPKIVLVALDHGPIVKSFNSILINMI